MTSALHGTGGARPRAGVKRPPGGAVGRCRGWRTGGGEAPATRGWRAVDRDMTQASPRPGRWGGVAR